MTKRHGRLSRTLPSANAPIDHVAVTLAIIGVTVSLGLIVISAVLNFRMGYRSADTQFDGYVYGLGAGLGDALKAISPFMAFYGLKHRDWLVVTAASAIYLVFTGYSFFAALGFAAEHRTSKAAITLNAIETRKDLRTAMARDESALEAMGPVRSSLVIEAAISKEVKKPVGPRNRTVEQISANCTLNREATRESCKTIAALAEEMALAQQREALVAAVDEARTKLAAQAGASSSESADPQVDAVRRVVRVLKDYDNQSVGFGLSVLLALFIELGSGLGLFVSTTPWRHADKIASPEPPNEAGVRTGKVEVYVLDHLEPDPQGEVRMSELYASYQKWCWGRGYIAHSKVEFRRQFADIAREVGMRSLRRNGQDHFQQLRLVKEAR